MTCALSKNTIYEYVSYLEEAFLLFKVDIWHRSVRAQARNPSKMYLIDPAFKQALTISEDQGRVLENAIFLHLRRQELTPYYVLNKQEVDFFGENGEPLNICLDFEDNSTKEREIKGMLAGLNFLDLSEGRILTRDIKEEITIAGKKIIVQPAWEHLLKT